MTAQTSNVRELRAILAVAREMAKEWNGADQEENAASAALVALIEDWQAYEKEYPEVDPQGFIAVVRDTAEMMGRLASELALRLKTAKWTVVGMHQGEPVHAHVECRKDEAWDEACLASVGDPLDVDWGKADGTGATGICLALFPGWIEGEFDGPVVKAKPQD